MKKAKLITIEGVEGSGKSSVIAFLQNYLTKKKYKVIIFQEPGTTKVGKLIRNILLDKDNSELTKHTELLLYLAARTQLIEEKFPHAVSEYDFIICDRFYDSTLVYQGIALGLNKVTPLAVKLFALGIMPDLTLILDTDPRLGLKRIKHKDRIESRAIAFHQRLRQGYLKLAKKEPKRIKVVNALGSLSDIYSRVEKALVAQFNL